MILLNAKNKPNCLPLLRGIFVDQLLYCREVLNRMAIQPNQPTSSFYLFYCHHPVELKSTINQSINQSTKQFIQIFQTKLPKPTKD